MQADGSQDANTDPPIESPMILCLLGIQQSLAQCDGDALAAWIDALVEELTIRIAQEMIQPCMN